MNTLETEWQKYRDACYPPENGPIHPLQAVETRQAFFAGCTVTLRTLLVAADKMSDGDAFKLVERMLDEVQSVAEQRKLEMEGRN